MFFICGGVTGLRAEADLFLSATMMEGSHPYFPLKVNLKLGRSRWEMPGFIQGPGMAQASLQPWAFLY